MPIIIPAQKQNTIQNSTINKNKGVQTNNKRNQYRETGTVTKVDGKGEKGPKLEKIGQCKICLSNVPKNMSVRNLS